MNLAQRTLAPVCAAVGLLGLAHAANAADRQPFSAKAFAAAEAAGRPILVHVYADWCPTCRAQEPVISRLSAADRFHQLVIFRLDYDHQAAQWRALGVRMQSTLIAFHGAKETARMVGGTDEASIEPVLDATLR
jgi:thioredoxin 1